MSHIKEMKFGRYYLEHNIQQDSEENQPWSHANESCWSIHINSELGTSWIRNEVHNCFRVSRFILKKTFSYQSKNIILSSL